MDQFSQIVIAKSYFFSPEAFYFKKLKFFHSICNFFLIHLIMNLLLSKPMPGEELRVVPENLCAIVKSGPEEL